MKTFIIIPALEPEPGLEQRVRELQEALPSQVIVIDDGSGVGYKEIFEAADRIRGCTVLRHGTNRGKGCALKTGFAYIKGKADQMQIVCADCDGQHLPADCARLAARSAECPGSLVLGVRDFSGDHVPWRSRFGNRISSRTLIRQKSMMPMPPTVTARAISDSRSPPHWGQGAVAMHCSSSFRAASD